MDQFDAGVFEPLLGDRVVVEQDAGRVRHFVTQLAQSLGAVAGRLGEVHQLFDHERPLAVTDQVVVFDAGDQLAVAALLPRAAHVDVRHRPVQAARLGML